MEEKYFKIVQSGITVNILKLISKMIFDINYQ